jgi:hypothetical protein
LKRLFRPAKLLPGLGPDRTRPKGFEVIHLKNQIDVEGPPSHDKTRRFLWYMISHAFDPFPSSMKKSISLLQIGYVLLKFN